MGAPLRELVLGGAGLIGSQLVQLLHRRGHVVQSLDLKTGCDLRDIQLEAFDSCDRVWFLAWDTGGAKYLGASNTQHRMYRASSELAARVFSILAETRQPFLFVTSQLAGQPHAYGLTKLMAEHWAATLGGRLARLWNVYGWEAPGEKSHVITDLVLSGLADGRVRCLTTGRERRRFLYKTDGAEALLALFESTEGKGDFAGSEWLTISQVAGEVARQIGVPVELGTSEGTEVMVDPEKLLTGWEPRVSLGEGIARVIEEARAFLRDRDPSRET